MIGAALRWKRDRSGVGSAFTLIEAVICVVVIAIAVPPTLGTLSNTSAIRVDAANTDRAITYAQSLVECLIADVSSNDPALGFGSLDDPATFESGFRIRVESVVQSYAGIGMTFDLSIGAPISKDGTASIDPDENVFRLVTITVGFPSARREDFTMPVSVIVGDM